MPAAGGSTAEIAEFIATILREKGLIVDVSAVKNIINLEDYGAVLVGSAAHMAAWLPEALRFVKTNRTRLNTNTGFLLYRLPDIKRKFCRKPGNRKAVQP